MGCRDRGCVDDGWGRLRCPADRMYPPWVFLRQGNQCGHLVYVAPARQSMCPPWVRSSSRTAQAPPPPVIRTPVPTDHGGRLRCHVGSQRVYLGCVAPARQSMCPPWVRSSSRTAQAPPPPVIRTPVPTDLGWALALPCWFTACPPWVRCSTRTAQAPPPPVVRTPVPTDHGWALALPCWFMACPPCVRCSSRTAQAPPPPVIHTPVPTDHGWALALPCWFTEFC